MTGVSDGTLHRLYKKSAHRRKDSGELDVFDATMYFYGGTETSLDNGCVANTTATTRKTIREELKEVQGGRRVSLDMHMSMVRNTNATQLPNPTLENSHRVSSKQNKEMKHKQPMSPGGRLASFLNSLFTQNSSRNKKKSQSVKDYPNDRQEETSVEGMRRRSSVSHFGSLWTSDSKSLHSSSSSGFRTPPHAKNATNAHNTDVRRNSDYKQVSPLDRKVTKNGIAMGSSKDDLLEIEKRKNMDLAWLEENMKLIDGLSEKNNKRNSTISPCNGLFKKDKIWIDDENDCGDGESDSSSDLFELQNYDVGLYSNGLPVYETTNIDSIKRGPPITNGHDPNF
ncbi:hypothetical protein MKW94_023520 [Papaver nudicaule]|uniref:Protein BIG GRAIN 1-like E n=1 Tax=Papaver nudicaule TaxID=74823 RepID=A0AA41VME1_PAPNU|nr:hypothetical protein [Papaver nudicaule]